MIKSLIVSTAVAGLLCAQSNVAAAPVEWSIAAGGNGHRYDVVLAPTSSGISWTAADAAASAAGGWLATLNSAAEDQFVFGLAQVVPAAWRLDGNGNGRGPWIGGFQPPGSLEPAGGWQWVDNEGPFVFANWEAQQPNNTGGIEDRAQFFARQQLIGDGWNDAAKDALHPAYIIEFASQPVPLPGAVWLLGSALAGMVSITRRRR